MMRKHGRFTAIAAAVTLSAAAAGAHAAYVASPAGTTEWRFDSVTGSGGGAVVNAAYGPGTMTQVGALTGNVFGTTGNVYNGDAIPDIGGQASGIVYTIGSNSTSTVGYRVFSNVDGPNDGHRSFTMVFDVFIAQPAGTYTSLYQGSATNGAGNDVDGYLVNGTQATGWNGTAGQFALGEWQRIVITRDNGSGLTSFYANGAFKASGVNADYVFDGGNALPFWILSDDNANHTDSAWAAFAFVPDVVLSPSTIAALGGPDALGIFNIPAPAALPAGLALLAMTAVRRRRVVPIRIRLRD